MRYMDDFDRMISTMQTKWNQIHHDEEPTDDELPQEQGHHVDEL